MSFVQLRFLVFLAVVFALYWRAETRRAQNAVLLVSSLLFYGWVHPWFVLLLLFSVLLDYGVALGMRARPARRRALLALSLVGNLGLLGVFKYLDFFLDNIAALLAALGLAPSVAALGIYLPVGISFFTFQTLSYTIDVYRGRVEPRRDLLDYATFVCLFPQLVAGPIERARDLLPQLEVARHLDWSRVRSGLGLALWGAVKKVVVADTLALYVDRVYQTPQPSKLLIGVATVGFASQILADFSGYTDIARGTARMLGIELVENFKSPYLSTSPAEHWRRWHVSLSTWIHEYVYVPLGGSRRGPLRRVLATYGAMLVSGLWHGASWNFVLWGAFHATLLVGYRAVRRLLPPSVRDDPGLRPHAVALMFSFTCMGYLLFRERDVAKLWWIATRAPLRGSHDQQVITVAMLAVTLACSAVLVAALGVHRSWLARWRHSARWPIVEALLWTAAVLALFFFARDTARDFIYFRF